MTRERGSASVLLLHPGAMGSAIGSAMRKNQVTVGWVVEGRSDATFRRAKEADLVPHASMGEALDRYSTVISVCPPGAAMATMEEVVGHRFAGLYVDANAVSPSVSRAIAARVRSSGGAYVDGGIVGPPPSEAGTTRLYICGTPARRVAKWFRKGPIEAIVLDAEIGGASAVKMAYAAWTKGSAALLIVVRSLAKAAGVEAPLLEEWDKSIPGLRSQSEVVAKSMGPKAWRFVAEMREIEGALEEHSISYGFHEAAAQLYYDLECFKDCEIENACQVFRRIIERSNRQS